MKKTEILSIRIDKETKEKLEQRAKQYKWSVSQTADQILNDFFYKPELYKEEEKVPSTLYITKANEETIYAVSKEKRISYDEAANIIIEHYGVMWP